MTAMWSYLPTHGSTTTKKTSKGALIAEILDGIQAQITAEAANLGGVDGLLAGRPGSREADYVRQIVSSTVPEDELRSTAPNPCDSCSTRPRRSQAFGVEALYWEAVDAAGAKYADVVRQVAAARAITAP